MARRDGEAAPERADTRRLVLRREVCIVVPEGVGSVDEDKLREALGLPKKAKVVTSPAWLVVGEFVGDNMTKAIEAHAGKPGTPDAIPGVYKAPSCRAWAGGEEYVKPPEPKVERKALEE
jgi:hypothetical protein